MKLTDEQAQIIRNSLVRVARAQEALAAANAHLGELCTALAGTGYGLLPVEPEGFELLTAEEIKARTRKSKKAKND